MNKNSKIYIAGHNGLVGSAIFRKLKGQDYTNIITASRQELDLLNQQSTLEFFEKHEPDYVFITAAKVGGIIANRDFPAEFIYQNLQIQNNIIHSAHLSKVTKLLFLGSSCIYPKMAKQPIKEEYLLTGPLEITNEAYAIAKIAGLTMTQKYNEQYGDKFISAMPTNLYGPGDNFHPEHSHVIPGLIRKFIEAKESNSENVTIWGSGKPMREFLFIDDLAEGLIFLMKNYEKPEHINIGTGVDVTIRELAELIKKITDFKGELEFDTSKPDGTPRKVMDVSKINDLGWTANTSLEQGLKLTIDWFIKNRENIREK